MFRTVTSLRLSQKVGAMLGGLLVAGIISFTSAQACDAISDVSYVGQTYVEAERAVIIWDQTQHVEHFIRQATVHSGGDSMAFLVPTPETPQMSNADPKIYDLVNTVGQPTAVAPVNNVTPWDIFAPYSEVVTTGPVPNFQNTLPGVLSAPKTLSASKQSPAILEQDVAGYHATVLATEDYPAISAWLQHNGFSTSPQVEAWIKSYAARHWMINAFKLIKPQPNEDGIVTTPPLCLSFHTDAPYYPYSEPADHQLPSAASPDGRILTVSVLSNQRMDGALADHNGWPGQLQYAGPASTGLKDPSNWLAYAGLDDGKNAATPPSHLTVFVDKANPRNGTADLYFSPSSHQGFYRAEVTDDTLPTITRLDWSRPFSLLSGFAVMLLVPGAPLYCGVRTLVISRRRKDGAPLVESPRWRVADAFLGLVAVLVGMLAAIPFGIVLIVGFVGLVQGDADGIVMFVFAIPALLVCLATAHCGHRAHNHWKERPARRSLLAELRKRTLSKPKPISLPANAAPVEERIPVPLIHVDPVTSEVTMLEPSGSPLKRYDRTMAVGSVAAGLVALVVVTTIFLASGAI